MDTSKVSHWLQIIGNFGLIAGLVLVGIQINQNTQIARADLVSRAYEAGLQVHIAMMGENPASSLAKAAASPDELTDEDLLVLGEVADFWTDFDTRIEVMQQQGFTDPQDAMPYWKSRATYPYGANLATVAMWEERRDDLMSSWQWARVVDEQFRRIELNTDRIYLNELRERISALTD